MTESKGSYWPYIVIALLCFGIASLLRIEKEVNAQRTPEQIAVMDSQEQREKESMANREAERDLACIETEKHAVDGQFCQETLNKLRADYDSFKSGYWESLPKVGYDEFVAMHYEMQVNKQSK